MRFSHSSLLLVFVLLQGCQSDQLVGSAELPSSENGASTMDRFFVVGGASIYELTSGRGGTRSVEAIVTRDDCLFGGLTSHGAYLYAACTNIAVVELPGSDPMSFPLWSDLVRVDLDLDDADPGRIMAASLDGDNLFPNGMAVDDNGSIYISNSYAFLAPAIGLSGSPALIEVRVIDEATFDIGQVGALDAMAGGFSPNGLQIHDERLFLASFNQLFEGTITDAGVEDMSLIYETEPSNIFDDFAILPYDILAVAEITNPFTSFVEMIYPGTSHADTPTSQLTYVATQGSRAGEVVHEHPFDPEVAPSSATLVVDETGLCLYVTDYFSGGLQRVSFEAD